MGNKTNDQRAGVATALERVRSQISLVLGAAEGARREAEAELEKLDLERQIVAAGMNHATAEQQAGWRLHPASAEVFPLLRSVRSQFYSDWTAGPNALRELVTANAPGPAGRPPSDWLGRVGVNTGISAPGLWRVGSATVEGQDIARVFDVAIPLLDASHLAITSAPRTRPVEDAIV